MNIKRSLCLFIFILLSSAAWAGFISVSSDNAFLRSNPNPKSAIVIGVPKYYPLYVIAKSGKWYKVKDWMNTIGWIPKAKTSKDWTVIVRKNRVNFRTGPGRGYRKIEKIYQGYIFKVIKKYGYWLKLKMVDPPKGKVGWIYKTLVWGY